MAMVPSQNIEGLMTISALPSPFTPPGWHGTDCACQTGGGDNRLIMPGNSPQGVKNFYRSQTYPMVDARAFMIRQSAPAAESPAPAMPDPLTLALTPLAIALGTLGIAPPW
jgi:hypothetical protein